MKNGNSGKFLAIMLLLVTLITVAVGCGNGDGGGSPSGSKNSGGDGIVEKASKYFQSKGRSYEHVYTTAPGMTLTNSFFDWSVRSVESSESLTDGDEEILPSTDANKFIIADISARNISDQEIPVGNYDYVILWKDDDGEAHEDNAYEEFIGGMYPDEVVAQTGQVVEGKLIFEVPLDVNEGTIAYYEYYEDEFKGDAYLFSFDLDGDGYETE